MTAAGRTPDPASEKVGIRTWTDWQRWARRTLARVDPGPLSTSAWDRLSSREQLRREVERDKWHQNMPKILTSKTAPIYEELHALIKMNALCDDPLPRMGACVQGLGAEGKSTLLLQLLSDMQPWLEMLDEGPNPGTRDSHIPLLYVPMPSTPTPLAFCRRALHFYGEPWSKADTADELKQRLLNTIDDCRTQVLAFDEYTRLQVRRERDREVSDFVKDLMEVGATVLFIGIDIDQSGLLDEWWLRGPGSEPVRLTPADKKWLEVNGIDPLTPESIVQRKADGRYGPVKQVSQTQRRFQVHTISSYEHCDDEYVDHLRDVEQNLRLLGDAHDALSTDEMAQCLHHLSKGVVGRTHYLIRRALVTLPAAATAAHLTPDLLARIKRDVDAEAARRQEKAETPSKSAKPRARRGTSQDSRKQDRKSGR